MNRKKWSNEEKVTIVLEILRGTELVAAICATAWRKCHPVIPVAGAVTVRRMDCPDRQTVERKSGSSSRREP
jgi:hypothetical protein